jgi:NitT/TauT family transport system substrate-binding protein
LILALEDEARWAISNKLTDRTDMPNYLNYVYLDAIRSVAPSAVTIIH